MRCNVFSQCSVQGVLNILFRDNFCGGCNAKFYIGQTEVTSLCGLQSQSSQPTSPQQNSGATFHLHIHCYFSVLASLRLLIPPRWPSGKASASRGEDPGFESRLRRDFSGSSHTSDFKVGTPVATLPGAWRYRVSAGTGWPGVSIL